MAKKIKDLAVSVGKYQAEDGKTKNRYLNVGAVLETSDGGKFILLDRTFNPAGCPNPDGKSTVLISMFDVKGKEESHKGFDSAGDVAKPSVMEDEIPF